MDRGGDVFGTLAWGVRRYAWLVVLTTVAVGVLVPFVLSQGDDVYEAQATVQAKTEVVIPSTEDLPRFGENTFNNGAVAEAIRTRYGLSAEDSVIPERVELITGQDALGGFIVIGRDDDPDVAADLAAAAGATFQSELNDSSGAVGTFYVQEAVTTPGTPEPKLVGGPLTIALGVLGGLLLGLGLVALLLVLRRPVLDAAAAQDATGSPVLGRVTLPKGRGTVNERDTQGLGALSRRLLAGSAPVILMVSPRSAVGQRHRLSAVLASLLGRSRNVFASRGGEEDLPSQWELATRRGGRKAGQVGREPTADRTELVLVDGPTVEERTHRPDSSLTLLVVPEGIALGALRQAADEYLDGEPGGVVLVRTRRPGRFRREPVDQAPVAVHDRGDDDDEPPSIFTRTGS